MPLSHHSEVNPPVAHLRDRSAIIASHSLVLFSFPFFSSFLCSLSPLGTFQSASLVHLFLFAPRPPILCPGCSTITHHLVITGTKRALVAWLQPLSAHRHWGKTRGKSPACPDSLQSSSPPPQMMKTLSVWIRMDRRALTRGITVIKAMPLHLCMSIPLSTYNVSLYTNFGIPSLSCCSLHCEAAVKPDLTQLSGLPVNLMIKVCMRVLRFSKFFNVIQVFQESPRKVKPGRK